MSIPAMRSQMDHKAMLAEFHACGPDVKIGNNLHEAFGFKASAPVMMAKNDAPKATSGVTPQVI